MSKSVSSFIKATKLTSKDEGEGGGVLKSLTEKITVA